MQVLILAVGKDSSAPIAEIQKDYERRLKPYASVSWKLLPASQHGTADQARSQESEHIIAQLKPSDTVILLDERGQQQTNETFAKTFVQLAGSHGRVVFVIGGAFGVNDELRQRASFVWSLSKLVFPHQLVRILLLEQLYRTFMVMSNHPYHHS